MLVERFDKMKAHRRIGVNLANACHIGRYEKRTAETVRFFSFNALVAYSSRNKSRLLASRKKYLEYLPD